MSPAANGAPTSLRRRRLIQFGLVGAAMLGGSGAWLLNDRDGSPLTADGRFASDDLAALWDRVSQVMLRGALPTGEAERAAALSELAARLELAHQWMQVPVRAQLSQLYGLLLSRGGRLALTGIWSSSWAEVRPEQLDSVMADWSRSSLSVKRSAYNLFHDLCLGTWYGMPQSWARIAYPGPPF